MLLSSGLIPEPCGVPASGIHPAIPSITSWFRYNSSISCIRRRIHEMLLLYLNQEVMEGMAGWIPEAGTPQGSGISPLLSNIYLDELDQRMKQLGYEMVRYADDF